LSWRVLGPSIVALGILVSSVAARVVPAEGPAVLVGPALMAALLIAVAVVDRRRFGGSRAVIGGAVILAFAVLLAGTLSARRDPGSVAEKMWLYGAAAGASMSLTLGRGVAPEPPEGPGSDRP